MSARSGDTCVPRGSGSAARLGSGPGTARPDINTKGEEDPWTLAVFLVAHSFLNKVCDAAVALGWAGPEASRLPQFILHMCVVDVFSKRVVLGVRRHGAGVGA